jgi:hypothetical protein
MSEPKLFLDSGAFTLFRTKTKGELREFFRSEAFREYAAAYAAFVKDNSDTIDVYATIDAIFDPELTWEIHRHLEQHGLRPCPVVHYGSDVKWVGRYVEAGYDMIALGGLAAKMRADRGRTLSQVTDWLDRVFSLVCPKPSRLPRVKIHGFGVMSHPLLVRYPWWSTDSTSWFMIGNHGHILIPPRLGREYVYSRPAVWVTVSDPSSVTDRGRTTAELYRSILDGNAPPAPLLKRFAERGYVHSGDTLTAAGRRHLTAKVKRFYNTSRNRKAGRNKPLAGRELKAVQNWCEEINLPIGGDRETDVRYDGRTRNLANVLYYQRLVASLPDWPWPFRREAAVSIDAINRGLS